MKKYTSKEILENLNEQGILTRNDYTFVEYVEIGRASCRERV